MPMLKKREDLTDSKDNNAMFALGLSDQFENIFVVKDEEEQEDIDTKIAEVNKMDLDEETKIKIINEYNSLRNAKSFKEKTKYQKNIKNLLKK